MGRDGRRLDLPFVNHVKLLQLRSNGSATFPWLLHSPQHGRRFYFVWTLEIRRCSTTLLRRNTHQTNFKGRQTKFLLSCYPCRIYNWYNVCLLLCSNGTNLIKKQPLQRCFFRHSQIRCIHLGLLLFLLFIVSFCFRTCLGN